MNCVRSSQQDELADICYLSDKETVVMLAARGKLLTSLTVFLLTACLLAGCGGDDKYVSMVKNGSMDMAPNVKIGKAFDDFFGNPQWKSFVSTDNERIVEFSGNCTFANKPAHCKIQFVIQQDNRFQWKATTLNDVNMPWMLAEGLLRKALGV